MIKRFLFLIIFLLVATGNVVAQIPPDTEVGDVVIRELDALQLVPYLPTYAGHAGIFDQWYGGSVQDSDNYMVYDMAKKSATTIYDIGLFPPRIISSTSTIVHRTFKDFTRINLLLGIARLNYGGGYTRGSGSISPVGTEMSPSARQQILTQAATWLNRDMKTSFLGFNKEPSNDTFRCDSWVEYILEQANVNNGQGLVLSQYENRIASPYFYAINAGRRERGIAPAMAVTTIGGGTVPNGGAISSTTITVTATEEATGSGLAQVELYLGSTLVSSRALSGLTANETFPSLADGSYTVAVYDLAGNSPNSEGFIIGRTPFLVENCA